MTGDCSPERQGRARDSHPRSPTECAICGTVCAGSASRPLRNSLAVAKPR